MNFTFDETIRDKSQLDAADYVQLLASTQGHIIEKHGHDHAANLLLRFTGPSASQSLAGLAKKITSAQDLLNRKKKETRATKTSIFCGLTGPGIAKLGQDTKQFVPTFLTGFRSRANSTLNLSDEPWKAAWKGERFDGLLVVAADSRSALESCIADLQKALAGSIVIAANESCEVIRKGPQLQGSKRQRAVEHFGFVDGVSQPVLGPNDPGARDTTWQSKYDPGYPFSSLLVTDPLAKGHFGSFLAYLRIEQHVDRFNQVVKQLAASVTPPGTANAEEEAAAAIIGRYKDGQPLIPNRVNVNDFSRSDDEHGKTWPIRSHICKMNPREGEGSTRRPIARRGMTYRENGEAGLIFQSFQASLSGQFELLLGNWAQDPFHPQAEAGTDPILPNGTGQQCFPLPHGASLCTPALTTIRGGEYFYFPSIPGLAALGQ